jgi:integrase/recombinase XerD
MNADFLAAQLVAYLSLREALGFQMRAEKLLLPEFVAFIQAQQLTGPIRAQLALEWACQASARRGASGEAQRLSIARRFLAYLQASAPDTEVPAPSLLPTPRRSKPYLFTPSQLTTLFEEARASRPRGSLRPHTLSILIGLLASTGLRVGEAIRLQINDVLLDLSPPQLYVLETKFNKSRIVPLHPTTVEQLHHYREQRALALRCLVRRLLGIRTGRAPDVPGPVFMVWSIVPTLGHGARRRGPSPQSDVVSAYLRGELSAAMV